MFYCQFSQVATARGSVLVQERNFPLADAPWHPAIPCGVEPNSCQSQSGAKEERGVHWDRTSVIIFVLLLVWKCHPTWIKPSWSCCGAPPLQRASPQACRCERAWPVSPCCRLTNLPPICKSRLRLSGKYFLVRVIGFPQVFLPFVSLF